MTNGLKLWGETVLVKNCVCFQVCGRRELRVSCSPGAQASSRTAERSGQNSLHSDPHAWVCGKGKKTRSQTVSLILGVYCGERQRKGPGTKTAFPGLQWSITVLRGVDQELSDSRACIHGEIFYSSPRHAPGNCSTWRVGTGRVSLSGGLRRAEQGQARWGGTGLRHSRPQADLLRHPCLLTVDTTCQVGVTGFM